MKKSKSQSDTVTVSSQEGTTRFYAIISNSYIFICLVTLARDANTF